MTELGLQHGEPKPFHVMAKPNGPRCNIDCSYCYYLEKEKFYPGERKFRMSETVLDAYVRQMIGSGLKSGLTEITFGWQGGEPTLMGLDFFRRAVALQQHHAPEGVRCVNTIQTNGMLIDDEWAAFLSDEQFLVGISVDGPRAVHDRYRRDRAGRATFSKVMEGLERLRSHEVDYNILCTVNRANAGKGKEIYRFLRDLGSPHLQFIPIIERVVQPVALRRHRK